MKRLLTLALFATAALAGSATPSSASTFGLFYSCRSCNNCNVCLRPYNAFTPVCGGVGEFVGGGCSSGNCGKFPPPYGFAPYYGYPVTKKGACCYQDGTPIPGAPTVIEAPAASPTTVAGNLANGTQTGMMPHTAVQYVSYPSAYPAYPVYPMGYAPTSVWGGYPMPAYYPAPAAPQYGYPIGR